MISRIYSNLRRNNVAFVQRALYASNQGTTPKTQDFSKREVYGAAKPEETNTRKKEDLGQKMEDKFQDWKGKVESKAQDIKEGLEQQYSNTKQNAKETVKDKVQGVEDMANAAANKGKQIVDEAAKAMKDKGIDIKGGMKNLKDTVKDDVNDLKDKAKSYANEAYHKGAAGAEHVKRDVKEAVDHSFSSDRSWTEQAKETAENLTGIHSTKELKEKISNVAEKAKETISNWMGSTSSNEGKERETDTTKDFNREKMENKKK